VVPRPGVLRRLIAIEAAQGLEPDGTLRLGVLTVGVGEDAGRVCTRLKPSLEQMDVLDIVANAMNRPFGLTEPELRQHLYWTMRGSNHGRIRDYICTALLAWVHAGAAVDDPAWSRALTLPARWQLPPSPVRGADVIARGVPPGPHVGEIIRAFDVWWVAAGWPADRAVIDRRLAEIMAEITHVN
jgi:poly(A) polymerase